MADERDIFTGPFDIFSDNSDVLANNPDALAGNADILGPASGPSFATLWAADHEDGTGGGARATGGGTTTLKEYYSPEVGATGNFGGGEYNGAGTTDRSTEQAHSGSGSAKFLGPSTGDTDTRLFRWIEGNSYRELFYEAWYYLPAKFALNGPDTYCIIFEFKSRNQDGSRNDPFWYITIQPQAGLAQRLMLWWGAQSGLAGPQSGDPAATFKTYSSTTDVPQGQWFKLRAFMKASKDFDGQIKVWYTPSPGGVETLLWDIPNVRTGFPNTNFGNAWQTRAEWATTLYTDGTNPGFPVLYVDSARIQRELPVGGSGSFATIAGTGSNTGSTQTAGTAHSVNKPGTASTGDTAEVAIVIGPGSGGTAVDTTISSTPTGWALVSSPTNVGGSADGKLYRYRRRLDGTSNDDFACTTVLACKSASLVRTYSNVDATTPGDVVAQTASGSAQASGQVPAISTVTNKAMVVGVWANLTGSGTITAPTGMTEGATIVFSGGYRLSLFEQGPITPPGAFGPTTATFNATRQWGGSLDALRPTSA